MNNSFITKKGKRKSNQDVILIKDLGLNQELYLLADGMGGYQNGKFAADFVVTQLYNSFKSIAHFNKENIQDSVNNTTIALKKEIELKSKKLGATLGGVIVDDNKIMCFWVGDVKIFHFKKDKIIYESKEHNLKNELIENNVFTESESANKFSHVVTRSIQSDLEKSKIGFKKFNNFEKGDLLIICSDGVTDVINNYELLNLFKPKCNVLEKINELDAKLSEIAKDNYSLILLY